MLAPEDWHSLLRIEDEFLLLEQQVLSGRMSDYRQIPPQAFAWHAWDQIPTDRLFRLILPFLRQQAARARKSLPAIYGQRLSGIDPAGLETLADWQGVPLLVKDDDPAHNLRGFRDQVNRDPLLLRPADLAEPTAVFGSGGSLGRYTPTFVTWADRERETQGWRRGHAYHGLVPGDRALFTYNTTHKGGQWMQESLWAHGLDVHLRRPEEDARRVLENLRDYQVNVLFTVQQPHEAIQQEAKAAGLNLQSLIMASLENPDLLGILLPDREGRQQIQFLFLGGFEIVPYAVELIEEYLGCLPAATLLGSSEAIPQACSTHPGLTPAGRCHYNHLHLLQGPHFIEVVKPEGEAWVPVAPGEEGLLVYTSWARDGTIWLRYAPGDAATLVLEEGECPCGLFSPVIGGVHRIDSQERQDLLVAGCAAG